MYSSRSSSLVSVFLLGVCISIWYLIERNKSATKIPKIPKIPQFTVYSEVLDAFLDQL